MWKLGSPGGHCLGTLSMKGQPGPFDLAMGMPWASAVKSKEESLSVHDGCLCVCNHRAMHSIGFYLIFNI